ncbi:MAG TPA: 6-phosphogluconolactonase, partial [Bacteroidales bacterium]|nr:6-phosphogluconolactonase [Bacteroidales bacterium]
MVINEDFTKRYEKVPVEIFDDSKDASLIVVNKVASIIKERNKLGKHTVIGLSASSSLIQVYEELAKMVANKELSFKNTHIFSVHEYYPLGKNEIQSHYRFIKEYLLDYIDIPIENIHCIDSEIPKEKVHDYCIEYEKLIESLGGIDILLIDNMGFNEPGSYYNSRTRLITLNYNTRVAAASE